MSHDFTDTIFGGDEPPPLTRRELREARRPTKPPRRTGLRSIAVFLAVLVLVGGAGYGAWSIVGPAASGLFGGGGPETDIDFPGPGEGEVEVVVEQGNTGEDIATALRDAGVTKTRTAYLEAAAADPAAAATIQAGTYSLQKGMQGVQAFAALTDRTNLVTDRVTVREGLWASEIFAELAEKTGKDVADYEKAVTDPEVDLPSDAGGEIEGWLFPASYEFTEKTSAVDQVKRMVEQTKQTLEEAGVAPEAWQRTLIVASIVEGEARGDADRGKVARVVENRLADPDGPTLGFLQMDSTVNYALKKRGNLTKTEYDSAKSDPYDTYGTKGLPPGPIGNPGKAAIQAAADPTPGGWFYFVAINLDTGETLFAETFEEQQANQQKLNQWCRDNPGKCSG